MQTDSDDSDDDGDWEGWAEPDDVPTRDLFSSRIFDSATECLAHAAKEHGLDLAAIAHR